MQLSSRSLVEEETIRKCFRKAGILDLDMAVVERDEEDPFSEADECVALQSLIDKTISGHEACPLEEYINGDEDLAVCRDINDNSWESTFFKNLGQEDEEVSDNEEQEEQEDMDDNPPPKVKTYKEANEFLEEVQRFLETRGHVKEALTVGSVVDNVSSLQLAAARQTTLISWLSSVNN